MSLSEAKLVHDILAVQVRERPRAIAVRDHQESLTYADVDERSDRLAHALRSLGVGPEVLVGVCLERGVGLLVSFFAVLKAGGAYVPLDPANPERRLAQLVQDAGICHLVADRDLTWAPERASVVHPGIALAGTESRPLPPSATPAGGLCYVVHTSGSTGRPKGVMVSHANALSLVAAQRAAGLVPPGASVLGFAPIGFDASVWEMLLAVGYAAPLVFVESRPEALLEVRDCVATLVPSVLAALEPEKTAFAGLISAGESLSAGLARRWAAQVPLRNAYGPTEATVCVTISDPLTDFTRPPSIGRLLSTATAYVLDPQGRPVADGEEGELWVGGPGVARGYLGAPGLTATRFRADPWGPPGSRLYRTGDLVRRTSVGEYEFLGRVDEQVKINGRRVELGEIESALTAMPEVASARVAFERRDEGASRLVAAVQPAPDRAGERPASAELLDRLRDLLPDYMVPSTLSVVESFPLTVNGKLDVQGLLAAANPTRSRVATFDHPAKALVAAVWAAVLNVDHVEPSDDFLSLGGHSLLATRLVGRLRSMLGQPLSMRILFRARVLSDFVAAALGDRSQRAYDEDDATYWSELLAGAPGPFGPPGGRQAEPASDTFVPASWDLSEDQVTGLERAARNASVSALVVYVAGFARAIARWAELPEVTLRVTSPVDDLPRQAVSMLLRVRVADCPIAEAPMEEVLASVSWGILNAYLHHDSPKGAEDVPQPTFELVYGAPAISPAPGYALGVVPDASGTRIWVAAVPEIAGEGFDGLPEIFRDQLAELAGERSLHV